jgi:hypothetical protein
MVITLGNRFDAAKFPSATKRYQVLKQYGKDIIRNLYLKEGKLMYVLDIKSDVELPHINEEIYQESIKT